MMKGIYLYMTMCAAAIFFTACTNELEESTVSADALVLTVGDYPVFSEGPDTRAVGTFDPGKTAWEEGDQILVSVSSNGSTTQYATLTYANSTWTPSQTLTRPSGTYTINAWYAPAYEWSNGTLILSSGKTAGTDEFLATTSGDGTITFTTNSRAYSRLRIAGASGTNLTVSLTNFTPAGGGTAPNSYALTTDSKGNAYLYGTWTGSSNLDVTYGSTSLVDKDNIAASVANSSYVVDASFTNVSNANAWNSIGDGTADCPYILLNGTQLNNLATNSSADKSVQYKMDADIDLSQYSSNWTPFSFSGIFDGNGHAITEFTYNSSNTQNFGLFNQNSGTIKNLTIKGCSISNTHKSGNSGAIAYYNNGGTIENCHVSGTIISGYSVGGIVQYNSGRIIACSNAANITATGSGYLGGICGTHAASTIIGCYNTGTINGNYAAGFVGQIFTTGTATISSCFTTSGNIYKEIGPFGTVNITNCYYLNGSAITNQDGGTVTDWQAATEAMNAQLGNYSYRYVQRNGTNQPPVIEATKQSQ